MGAPETSAAPSAMPLPQVIARARDFVALFTDMPVDQVVSCTPAQEGWQVVIDVVEAPARLGDNDLLATYEIKLSAAGDALSIERMRRYTREDLEAASR
ncbi:MAG: gas vesicle protein GvpO [Pseudomonadota bacterium]